MSLFFFGFQDEHGLVADEVGTDLPDLEAVKREAAATLAELAAEALRDVERKVCAFVVRDRDGAVVLEASLSFNVSFKTLAVPISSTLQ